MQALRHQGTPSFTTPKNQPPLIDTALIKAAGDIYYTYCEVHPEIMGQATGVAINRTTYRGKVIFTSNPALLPQECFVPIEQIESQMY